MQVSIQIQWLLLSVFLAISLTFIYPSFPVPFFLFLCTCIVLMTFIHSFAFKNADLFLQHLQMKWLKGNKESCRKTENSPKPIERSSIRAKRICLPAAHRGSSILNLQRDRTESSVKGVKDDWNSGNVWLSVLLDTLWQEGFVHIIKAKWVGQHTLCTTHFCSVSDLLHVNCIYSSISKCSQSMVPCSAAHCIQCVSEENHRPIVKHFGKMPHINTIIFFLSDKTADFFSLCCSVWEKKLLFGISRAN